jgi:dinuclear metal center YbgI/SA1388 family protein
LVLRDVVAVLDDLYDPRTAESWDRVGLVTGEPDQPVRKVLLAVDPAQTVIDEALDWGADLLLTHHPLLLRGVHAVTASEPKGRAVTSLIRAGVALHVAHTNADVAEHGVSDALAAAVGLIDVEPLEALPEHDRVKLVTFVPRESVDQVVDALASAGAGVIGDYERCAWTTEGVGTFRPGQGARPAVGTVGVTEQVAELRVEMVLPTDRAAAAVAALRSAHPYEEPAVDLLALAPQPGRLGTGRVGRLPSPRALAEFAQTVADALPTTAAGVRVAGDPGRTVERVAVCGGAGDSHFPAVRRAQVDAYVTADLRHHPAAEAREHGAPALLDCAHWATEWPWLPVAEQALRAGLAARADTVETRVSRIVTDPWTFQATARSMP